MAASVAHHWGHGHSWAPSDLVAGGRVGCSHSLGQPKAEAAEATRVQPGEWGQLLQENSLKSHECLFFFFLIPSVHACCSKQAPGLTQPNSKASPETIGVRVLHSPTLLSQRPQSQGCTLPLCFCHFALIPPAT